MKRYVIKVDERFEESCDALKERLAAVEATEEQLIVRKDEIAAVVPTTSWRSHVMHFIPMRLRALIL